MKPDTELSLDSMPSLGEPQVFIDGERANAAALARMAQFNFGHFTSMQVRDAAVRGLDLHMARLVRDAREVFDAVLDPLRVRQFVCGALGARRDASVRVAVFAQNWNLRQIDAAARLSVMVSVAAPQQASARPLRLMPVEHERFLPHIKHSATFDLFTLRRRARSEGFDDALIVDRHGHVCEGATWNIGFFDGRSVVWPQAARLDGVTMQLLRRGLEADGIVSQLRPVPLAQIRDFTMAFACNAGTVAQPVARVGEVALATDADFIARLVRGFERQPMQRL